MLADDFQSIDIDDIASFHRNIVLEKFAEIAFANKTDAGGILLIRNRQIQLMGNSSHFPFIDVTQWKHRKIQCFLVNLGQEVGLVLIEVRRLKIAKLTVDFF